MHITILKKLKLFTAAVPAIVASFFLVNVVSLGQKSQDSKEGNDKTKKPDKSASAESSEKEQSLVEEAILNLEAFLIPVKSFFSKANRYIRDIENLKVLVKEKQIIYDNSGWKEFLLYVLGFKLIWGLFIGYRTTFVAVAYEDLEKTKNALAKSQENLKKEESAMANFAKKAQDAISSLSKISKKSSKKFRVVLQKAKTKVDLFTTHINDLLEKILEEVKNEIVFQEAVKYGRSSQYYSSNYSISGYASQTGSSLDSNSQYSTGLDTNTKGVWEKAEADRLHFLRQELRQATQQAKQVFEDTKAIEELIEVLQEEKV